MNNIIIAFHNTRIHKNINGHFRSAYKAEEIMNITNGKLPCLYGYLANNKIINDYIECTKRGETFDLSAFGRKQYYELKSHTLINRQPVHMTLVLDQAHRHWQCIQCDDPLYVGHIIPFGITNQTLSRVQVINGKYRLTGVFDWYLKAANIHMVMV